MKNYDVIVIGAGSVGLPAAYSLAKKGLSVAVVEKLPSVGQGENKAAIGGIRATHSDPAKIKIGKASLGFIRRLKPEFGQDVDYVEGGYLFPSYQPEIGDSLKKLLATQKQAGLNIDWISPEDVQEIAPGIKREGLLGGTFSPNDGHLSSLKLAGAFYRMALHEGVNFLFNTEVVGFEQKKRRVTAVKTSRGSLGTSWVVNAAGAYGRDIGLMVGTELPVYPDSHEAGVTEPVKPFLEPMIVDIEPDEHSETTTFTKARKDP